MYNNSELKEIGNLPKRRRLPREHTNSSQFNYNEYNVEFDSDNENFDIRTNDDEYNDKTWKPTESDFDDEESIVNSTPNFIMEKNNDQNLIRDADRSKPGSSKSQPIVLCTVSAAKNYAIEENTNHHHTTNESVVANSINCIASSGTTVQAAEDNILKSKILHFL